MQARIRLLVLAVIAALVVACGSPSPSATPAAATPTAATPAPSATSTSATSTVTSPATDDAGTYASIEAQVEQLRELTASRKLDPTLLDEKGVLDYMTRAADQQSTAQSVAISERILKHLAMLQPDASLRQIELDLQESQVIGFYDVSTKQLYVVSTNGHVGPLQKVTFAHEFTHALQDQHFDLSSLGLDTPDQGDRGLARTALIEGDALISMTQWAQKNLSLPELLQIATMDTGASQQQLDAAPPIVRESLLFPYTQGMAFVQSIYNKGGWGAVDAIYSNPPLSTSQILHAELYTQQVKPVAVTVPAVPAALNGWNLAAQDTFGEFQFGVWLANGDATKQAAAAKAVSQWAGDRFGLYEGANGGWAIVFRTAWRSTDGASAFASAVANAPHAAGSTVKSCASGSEVQVVVASDASVANAFGCAGR